MNLNFATGREMSKRLKFVASLLVHVVVSSLVLDLSMACWGGGTQLPGKVKNKNNITIIKQILESNWGGFTVPQNVSEMWLAWLQKYNEEKSKKQLNNETKSDDGVKDWPESWKDGGAQESHEGFPPMEIPPWGYKAKNTGLPIFCYQAPDAGKCDNKADEETSKRWGFNPYLEQCQEFNYIGCEGNKNNFVEQLQCLETCTKPADTEGGCNLETAIPIENDQLSNHQVPAEFLNLGASRRCSLKQPSI